MAINISQSDNFAKIDTQNELFALQDDVIEKIESIMYDVLSKDTSHLDQLLADLSALCLTLFLSFSLLSPLSFFPPLLPPFRQATASPSGPSLKVWAGEEDNVVMKRLWEENGDIKPDDLYKELTKLYLALNKS